MTTLQQVELVCPVCESRFKSQEVVSTNAFGGRRTDLHERAAGTQPLPYRVYMCSECGYSAIPGDFGRLEIDEQVKERVIEIIKPRLGQSEPVTASEKYEFAAKILEWSGHGAEFIANRYLRAAWSCVEEGDVEAERYFRLKVIAKLGEALGTFDGVERNQRAMYTYLVGELWRRVGDNRLAAEWFNRVESEVLDPSGEKWLKFARQQRDCPREWLS
ncbi:DUF2225 domain-containing protein [Candidatus Parcubacteria bacterium]|nr:DUF2225 domain-containing protein [Candidatus Parcubacteria bacterium]